VEAAVSTLTSTELDTEKLESIRKALESASASQVRALFDQIRAAEVSAAKTGLVQSSSAYARALAFIVASSTNAFLQEQLPTLVQQLEDPSTVFAIALGAALKHAHSSSRDFWNAVRNELGFVKAAVVGAPELPVSRISNALLARTIIERVGSLDPDSPSLSKVVFLLDTNDGGCPRLR